MYIPTGPLAIREGVEFGFPAHLCCNCGTKDELSIIGQDTRRTRYLLAGGTETTLTLPLPFCPRCTPSAKRRPKKFMHRLLLLVLAYAGWFAGLVVLGTMGVLPQAFAAYLTPLTVVLALATTAAVMFIARPGAGQSSFFQPVRISRLKQEFVSGAVTAIGFSFTNRDYAAAFKRVNAAAIARKQLSVTAA